ncbi:CDP-glycerol glycerophosphotransferase family protein [Amnibacterium endophyticum]|uniref:CDP-glycerol glycerophosphotransferase family protein n=1 Tax=Amnibacterium endophyticum TaxID=2109337 RepID=A0ABW4LD07_9MICO
MRTLENHEPRLDHRARLGGGSSRIDAAAAAVAEQETMRSGPELDEARTAPIALVRPAEQQVTRAAPEAPPRITVRHVLRSGAVEQAGTVVAVVGLLTGIATGSEWKAFALAFLGLVLQVVNVAAQSSLLRGKGAAGQGVIPRLVLLAVVPLSWESVPSLIVAALVAAAVLSEPVIVRVLRVTVGPAVGLPGVVPASAVRPGPKLIWFVNTLVCIAVAAGADLTEDVAPAHAAVAALAVLVTGVSGVLTGLAFRASRRNLALLPDAVAAYAPVFALHWDAPPGTEYQVTMWLPYLERIGERFILIVRNPAALAGIAARTRVPVVLRQDPRDIDAVVPPSLRTVFYVNNAARNTHLVRFTGLLHVQLNHGESDKAPSYSPVFRLYDKDFVAGQAAIDRFAKNGVRVPDGLFTIVGRPQVEHVLVGRSTSDRPTALYAPTWGGANADSDYCSLPIGVPIVQAMLDRGYEVVFRPHPYTRRNPEHAAIEDRIHALLAADARTTGRRHRFGAAATAESDVVDCFNRADLLVSDVSSVVPDFLYSEKPFAVASMQCAPEEFPESFPIARAAYVLDREGENIDAVLDAMTGDDPLADARCDAKRYFLGDFPAEGYADAFLREARRAVLGAV